MYWTDTYESSWCVVLLLTLFIIDVFWSFLCDEHSNPWLFLKVQFKNHIICHQNLSKVYVIWRDFTGLSVPCRWFTQWQPRRSHCQKGMYQVCICAWIVCRYILLNTSIIQRIIIVFVCIYRYLIQELHRAVSGGDSSVFCQADERGKWKLQPGVSFLFFTSHTPCESSMLQCNLTGCVESNGKSLTVKQNSFKMTTRNWIFLSSVWFLRVWGSYIDPNLVSGTFILIRQLYSKNINISPH